MIRPLKCTRLCSILNFFHIYKEKIISNQNLLLMFKEFFPIKSREIWDTCSYLRIFFIMHTFKRLFQVISAINPAYYTILHFLEQWWSSLIFYLIFSLQYFLFKFIHPKNRIRSNLKTAYNNTTILLQ